MEVNQTGKLSTVSSGKLAVVGMGACMGGVDGLGAFTRAVYDGTHQPTFQLDQLPHPVKADLTFFGITGKKLLPPEDRLLIHVAGNALRDAGISFDNISQRIALLISRSSDLADFCIGRAVSAGSFYQFSGPFVNLSAEGDPLASALLTAHDLLESGQVDAVLVAASALTMHLEELFKQGTLKINTGEFFPGLDQKSDGWTPAEGASAIVLMRDGIARGKGKRIYACVDAFARVQKDMREPKRKLLPTFVSSEAIFQGCRLATEQAGVGPGEIGYLEVLASGFTPMDIAEIGGLTRAYQTGRTDLTCAIGSIQSNAGYLFNAAGITALVRTALCLFHRIIPVTPGWSEPKKPELWNGTPFYTAFVSRNWFSPPSSPYGRIAALNSIGWDGSSSHFILREGQDHVVHTNPFLTDSPFYLLPVAGDSPGEILDKLESLRPNLNGSNSLYALSMANFENYRKLATSEFAVAIVGSNHQELLRDVEFMLKGIPAAFEQGKTLQTPQGSYFTPLPVGKQGKVAFVYPGAFNSYIGLGKDLFILFPQLYERLAQLTKDPGKIAQELQLYPRSLKALSNDSLADLEAILNSDPVAMITTGSLMAILYTMIIQDLFQIQPAIAFGYSLGEIAMLFGTGVWAEADASSEKLTTSPLFHSRLAGPLNAVREYWEIQQKVENFAEPSIWSNYFLMTTVEKAVEAIKNEKRVYLTHINTPRQVVIAGDPDACQRVITTLKCTSLKAPFDFAMHCDAVQSEYNALTGLHDWPVAEKTDTHLYTAFDNLPLDMDCRVIADKVTSMLCSRLNFPALINQVYDDGARVFIELGANANCSKWIEETLKGKTFASAAINRRGVDDRTSIIRLLARLVSQRVSLDLSPLFQPES